MLSPKTKNTVLRVLPYGAVWLVFSTVYILVEKGLLGESNQYPSTGNPYNFSRNIWLVPGASLLTGLFIGVLEILYFGRLFAKKSFTKKILYKSAIYVFIILLFLAATAATTGSIEMQKGIFSAEVAKAVWLFLSNYAFISVALYMGAIIVVSQFYSEVSESIGRGVLANFFTGRYHTPVEEERIFMFLDMRSSTHIAEHLGHIEYFKMLKEYYADLSGPIVKYYGEIYQYVGDEVVVSWKFANGLKANNCIRCFFAMKAALRKQQAKYRQRFGVVPDFKAGLHLGKVTTGEIGTVKKDIIFTGDVLNTTARIQGLCNVHNVDLIASADLVARLRLAPPLRAASLGETELRGRDEKMELFTIGQA